MEKIIFLGERGLKFRLTYAVTVLSVICVSMAAYIGADFMRDADRAAYYEGLNAAEMKNAAYLLMDEAESGNLIEAYHHAKSAAEYAKKAGRGDTGVKFDSIAQKLSNGGVIGEEELETIRRTAGGDDFSDSESASIAAGLEVLNQWNTRRGVRENERGSEYITRRVRETAEENIKRLFGVKKLNHEPVVVDDMILYSCKNAYAALSLGTGQPIEFAWFLPRKPAVLGDEECILAANEFVREYFHMMRAESELAGISCEDGCVRVNYASSAGRITVLVERGEGRVVGLASV